MRILYTNDVHCSDKPVPLLEKAVEVVPKFFQFIKAVKDDIDLLVINGDLVNRGPVDISELERFKATLDQIGVDYQVTGGNHDLTPSKEDGEMYAEIEKWEDCSLEQTNFGRVFGQAGIRNVRNCGQLQLVFLTVRDHDPDGQIPRLQDVLAAGKPALIFCHYPLVALRTEGFGLTWGFEKLQNIRRRLVDVIQQHQHNILAYFCGHYHINSRMKIGTTDQIASGAAAVSTCCYKYIDIENGAIRITTHVLPGVSDWLGDAINPPESYDPAHPTVESYHWGNEDERNFTIEYADK